ncbi:hypothetical protein C4544_07275 [candidate division WS5 bacterium]|uniref:Glycosyltransferase RgtA/B/C/D-like domain-containing protein n=1 Tax=candidate division WS5 bacterium TaxID=2093353 RepID=A0A419DA00_9BACT|nr:MAG: hypothetical protein C4544_07275 [candidate division WS5 bacterium]
MAPFTVQYKYLFLLTWIVCYLIFPAWVFPSSITSRTIMFFGLMIFFFISAQFIYHWLKKYFVDKPVIVYTSNYKELIRNNKGLFIVCMIFVIFHVVPISYPILNMGDEALHLQDGLWLYDYIDISWHRFFQIAFWWLLGSIFIIVKLNKVRASFFPDVLNNKFSSYIVYFFSKRFLSFWISALSVVYFLFTVNIQFFPSFFRYPPLSKFLYYITYIAIGITPIGPRILELSFSILSAVYIYRTINLFSCKTAALIGASIYLFFPVVFIYARLGELACGTVFFITLISFYFIRHIKNDDNRDLVLTSYFIGIGFLYKEPVFLMFFICVAFLILYKIAKLDFYNIKKFNILLLSLVPIIPWMIFSQLYSWRHYNIIWTNFRPFDGKVFTFFLHFPVDISWVLFFTFLISIVYVIVSKRNLLTLFFGFLFIGYYFFLVLDIGNYSPRLYMALYPTIAVFISQLLFRIIDRIPLKHSFRIIYAVLIVYLISICTVPSINAHFTSSDEFIKLKQFPSDEAMHWVKENVKEEETILTLRIMSSSFYRDMYRIDKSKMMGFWYDITEVSTPEKLKTFCNDNKITYIMFPSFSMKIKILEYLNSYQDKDFIEITKFNHGDNYIYIYNYKVRDN